MHSPDLSTPSPLTKVLVLQPHGSISEVESSLISATTLHSSYHRILLTLPSESHASSDELTWAKSELDATLSALMADVAELDDAVGVLERDLQESGRSRFGVSENEVRKRRTWVKNVQQELNVSYVSNKLIADDAGQKI